MRFKTLLLPLFLVILIFPTIVKAYEVVITLPDAFTHNLQGKVIYFDNLDPKRYLVVYRTGTVYLKVYKYDGLLMRESSLSTVYPISDVLKYNGSEVIFAYNDADGYYKLTKFNLLTGALTTYSVYCPPSATSSVTPTKIIKLTYNNRYYWACVYYDGYNGQRALRILSFDGSAVSGVANARPVDINTGAPVPKIVYDPDVNNAVFYVIAQSQNSPNQGAVYKYDATSNSLTYVGTTPTTTDWYPNANHYYIDDEDGYIVGSDKYLFFTWMTYTSSPVVQSFIKSIRINMTSGAIESAGAIGVTDVIPAGYNFINHSYYVVYLYNPTTRKYFEYKIDASGKPLNPSLSVLGYEELDITDKWANESIAVNSIFKLDGVYAFERNVNNYVKFIIGGYGGASTYSLNVYCSPNDNPHIVGKVYTYLTEARSGPYGVPNAIVKMYVDNVEYTSQTTDESGISIFTHSVSTTGIHNFTFRLYVDESLVAEASLSYDHVKMPISGGGEGISQIISTGVIPLLIHLPTLLIILIPAFAIGQMFGIIGFISGLIIGVGVAVVGGLIPLYFVFLLVLVITFLILFLVRRGD